MASLFSAYFNTSKYAGLGMIMKHFINTQLPDHYFLPCLLLLLLKSSDTADLSCSPIESITRHPIPGILRSKSCWVAAAFLQSMSAVCTSKIEPIMLNCTYYFLYLPLLQLHESWPCLTHLYNPRICHNILPRVGTQYLLMDLNN